MLIGVVGADSARLVATVMVKVAGSLAGSVELGTLDSIRVRMGWFSAILNDGRKDNFNRERETTNF